MGQLCQVIDRYRGQSGIIYCISRAEVDKTAAVLSEMGYAALPYHAGMSDEERIRNQDAFLAEKADIIVATVAFGMGIDKSNVRYVIHSGMPKSLENYQQESGRAGRDGVESECWLFYSGRDLMTWQRILSDVPAEARAAAMSALEKMNGYATAVTCRHAALVEHFGQAWSRGPCGACDVCFGDLEVVDDALVLGQKILSCVLRVHENFGAGYVCRVLVGSKDQRIAAAGHEKLSTYGLLKEYDRKDVRQWIEQLVNQGFLCKEGEFNIVRVTEEGRRLLRGEQTPTLLRPTKKTHAATVSSFVDSWDGVDRDLFDSLRQLRRDIADQRGVPAYIILGDATLRDMARLRPSTLPGLLAVRGIGQQKLADLGQQLLDHVVAHCRKYNVTMDVLPPATATKPANSTPSAPTASAVQSFPLFDEGLSVEQVAERLGRAISTTIGYLESYIRQRRVTDATRWLTQIEYGRIDAAVRDVGAGKLRPIFEAMNGEIPYERIRIGVACLQNQLASADESSPPRRDEVGTPAK
jgi:ATP-dependent DNA helicase RecQ